MKTFDTFDDSLEFGKEGENLVAIYLTTKGYSFMPAYELLEKQFKGPQYKASDGEEYTAPDLFVFSRSKDKHDFWVESKRKGRLTWHYKTRTLTTGIDKKHFEHYIKVQEDSCRDVFVFFFHGHANPSPKDLNRGSPAIYPTGLWCASISKLEAQIHHEVPPSTQTGGYGQHGMYYWDITKLKKMEELDTLKDMARNFRYSLA